MVVSAKKELEKTVETSNAVIIKTEVKKVEPKPIVQKKVEPVKPVAVKKVDPVKSDAQKKFEEI